MKRIELSPTTGNSSPGRYFKKERDNSENITKKTKVTGLKNYIDLTKSLPSSSSEDCSDHHLKHPLPLSRKKSTFFDLTKLSSSSEDKYSSDKSEQSTASLPNEWSGINPYYVDFDSSLKTYYYRNSPNVPIMPKPKTPNFVPLFGDFNFSPIRVIEWREWKNTKQIIGQGGQSTVTKGIWMGLEVAIKRTTVNRAEVFRAIFLYRRMRHPNIIQLLAIAQPPSHAFFLLFELFGQSLHDILFKKKISIPLSQKDRIGHQLMLAIHYIHLEIPAIIHRDIKPGNILVEGDLSTGGELRVKLIDFEMAFSNHEDESIEADIQNGFCGTLHYAAPEILISNANANIYSDIWSTGCVLHALYSDQETWPLEQLKPELRDGLIDLYKKKTKPKFGTIPKFLKPKLERCFHYQPTKRPKAGDILHEYMFRFRLGRKQYIGGGKGSGILTG